jgi:membrane protease YdiL (CAAX protease family)
MEALNRNAIVAVSIVLEAALLLVAAIWMLCANIPLITKMQFVPIDFAYGCAAAVVSSSLSMLCFTLGKRVPLFADLRKMSEEFLAPLICRLSFADVVMLSLVSGFCEEVLFRGIIQAQCGIWATSLAFGIFHDPSFKQKSYVIMAGLAGLGLGFLYQATDNLWSCIIAHILHNLLAMLALRFFVKTVES